MKKECKICGRATDDNLTVVVKQGDKEIGTYDVCEKCLEHNCLIDPKPDDFHEKFEKTFGTPYLGSDFI